MPIYEYLCLDCKKSFSFLVGVVADSGEPECAAAMGKSRRRENSATDGSNRLE
jgi:putative FmdB family regulatory protein